jgi:hypothetical protein
MEEERLEQECDGSFLSSGDMSSVCHDVRAFTVKTALTRTLFPYPLWSNRIQALLRVTIYVVFLQPHYATSLLPHLVGAT